jgi:hypothetical protein
MTWEISPRLLKSEPLRRCGFPACRAACCLYGVWVDITERDRILASAELVSSCLPPDRCESSIWFETIHEADPHTPSGEVVHTRVLEDASHYGGTSCLFLREDSKCALQVAGELLSGDPWGLKPFYCILHPLDLDEEGRITLDETALLIEEAASCLVPSEEITLLFKTFEPELRYFLGDDNYDQALKIY